MRHSCLLQHDFRQPDRIGIRRMAPLSIFRSNAPGQAPTLPVIPVKQRVSEPRNVDREVWHVLFSLQRTQIGAKVRTMKRKTPSSMLEKQASRFLETHRGRPSYRSAPSAGRAAARILRPLARRFGPGVEPLKAHWSEIVGSRLSQWSEPEAILNQSGIQVLVIRARGPAGAVIQAESRRILDRVAQYAGAKSPTRIRIKQGSARTAATPAPEKMTKPSPTSQVSEGVEKSADDRLLSALDRFGKTVKSRNEDF